MMGVRLLSSRQQCFIHIRRWNFPCVFHKRTACALKKNSSDVRVLHGVGNNNAPHLPGPSVSLQLWRTPCFNGQVLPADANFRLCAVNVTFRVINLRHFHASEPRGGLPAPLVWMVLKPVQKLLAIILGRSIRKWWAALPPNRRQLLRQAAWRRRWQLAAGGTGLLVLLALFCLTYLDEAPVTGRTRLLVFSPEKFMELVSLTSDSYMEAFKESFISPEDPRHLVVEMVLRHLVQRNHDVGEMVTLPWSVHVVNSPDINAFVLPNGKVFVFAGMLEAVEDIHELTIVLGHEMAHAVIGHSAEQASLSHVVDVLSLILLTAIWAVCPRDSLAVLGQWVQGKLTQIMFERPYSRKLEAEADQVGMQLAAKACADVRAAPVFWQKMEFVDRGEMVVPEWLSTHPSHKNRMNQLERLLPEALELRESCDCPPLPNPDPRVVFSMTRQLLDITKQEKKGSVGQARSLPRLPEPSPPDTGPQLGYLLKSYIKPSHTSSGLEPRLEPSPAVTVTATD